MSAWSAFRAVLVAVLLCGGLVVADARAETGPTDPRCGKRDLPETGLQGDVPRADQESDRSESGYNCGLALFGHNDLGGRGGNANMAWAGDCSYISGDGIAVVDASDPSHPQHVTTLQGPGSSDTSETIAAVDLPGRSLLAAGRYGVYGATTDDGTGLQPAPMDIYDVSDCAHPALLSTFYFPTNIHNLTFSADGRRVYATLPLQVADVSDPSHPMLLGGRILQNDLGALENVQSHEAWPSPDGTRLYVGGQSPSGEKFTIVDIEGYPDRDPKIVSQWAGRGHSIRQPSIGGGSYLLHSDESVVDPTAKGCVPETLNPFAGIAEPWLTDITDEHDPVTVSQFHLAINDPANCAAQLDSGVNASTHYHDVDDASNTTFAMVSMWNAGVRVVDVRQPDQPKEVAYFNPGTSGGTLDQAWGHVRYRPESGQIWFGTSTGGFWIVELEPQVRHALELPRRLPRHAAGAPGRPVVAPKVPTIAAARSTASPAYCTLGSTRAFVPAMQAPK